MRYSVTKVTPRNMRYALCDICGFKYHIKDLTLITDKWNRKYGLLVCRKDLASNKPNPQDRPKIVKEELIKYTTKIRPQSEDTQYITNENDDRLPSKPTNCRTYSDPLDGDITLYWDAPQDQGSSPILYYTVQYSIPQRFNYQTLTSNTGSNAPYFKDTINPSSDHISYKIAAINGFGQGPYSDEFYWPIDDYADIFVHGLQYILTGDLDYITVGTGEPIVASGISA